MVFWSLMEFQVTMNKKSQNISRTNNNDIVVVYYTNITPGYTYFSMCHLDFTFTFHYFTPKLTYGNLF